MSDVAAPLPSRREAERPFALELRLSWEVAAYVSLIVVGAGMRLWDLGSRALHHDESLHAFYAYRIFEGGGYEHNPLLHGPFQFFGMALTFFLAGGASDYTARIFPALAGSVLIALPYLFRGRLGTVGALAAAGLIALSPTLLYFSRFARNDIYVALFTLGIVVCIWRYIDERKPLYLIAMAALLGLSFSTKENTFINVAILLVFLDLWLAAEFTRQSRRELELDGPTTAVAYAFVYLPFAWALVALWPLTRGLRESLALRELPPAGDCLIVLGTLSLPQLAAAVQVPLEAAGFPLESLGRERAVGIPVVIALLTGTAVVGLGWNWRVWLMVAAAFFLPYTLLYTSFFTHASGFGSGIWESLDYWLAQHDVRRGDQPDWYYVTLLPAYEYLALAFAGPALLYYSLRGGLRSWALTALAVLCLLAFFGADSFSAELGKYARPVSLPVAAVAVYFAVTGSPFERFLVFWTGATLVGYSWVGEKMPWLSVHTTLPVVILAAYTIGRLFERLPEPAGILRYAPGLLPLAAGALGMAALVFAAFGPEDALTLRLALAGLAVGMLIVLLPPLGRRRLGLVLAAALIGGLGMFSVRTAIVASFEHGDVPREMLVYTQTSPDVPDIMERIDQIALTSGLGEKLTVVVDTTYTWPWAWYLRDYDIRYDGIGEKFEPPEGAVLLIASGPHEQRIAPYLSRYQEPVLFRLRWWFPEGQPLYGNGYRNVGRDNLWLAIRDFGKSLLPRIKSDFLIDWGAWDNWWRYFRDRVPPGELGSADSVAYFPRAFEEEAPSDVEGRLTIAPAPDGDGTFNDPGGLAVDAEGNVYVADTGNARVSKFDAEGQFIASVGEPGEGEGQFNQPADLALDAEGNLYVLDTWNHRVQKFDANLTFVAAFGKPTDDLLNPGPDEMWGPRSIAVDGAGDVWVVDTGTARVRKFSADGKPLGSVGSRGDDLGQFLEPVGIAIDPRNGDALVADTGNARIQRLSSKLVPLNQYAIEEWQDLDPNNKPDLAVLPDGRILASDPPHGRILLLEGNGRVIAALNAVSGQSLAFPRGLAYLEDGDFVYTSEALLNQVRRFPLSDFALR